ncbi:hypothetical protein CLV84_0746 [Neolewinella xylanilytica]|uniref:Uncharacterized protein n=1 Tax=Neolewinella xylanilytica TaxID=1514080 RepID=A0A2S6I8H4_9BACT|nr:hypothetical protein [Neolewinella xylanilytica]PPK87793.1 hypothetical protein CLV84_0746 [Neolewinella xylanilytica]
MLDLEDILRQGSQEPQPGGPPPGGFTELQRRLGQQPAAGAPWLVYFLTLLLFAVAGLAYWSYPTEESTDAKPATTLPALEDGTDLQARNLPATRDSETKAEVGRFTELKRGNLPETVRHRVFLQPTDTLAAIRTTVYRPAEAVTPPLPSRSTRSVPTVPSLRYAAERPILPPVVSSVSPVLQPRRGTWDLRLNLYPNPREPQTSVQTYADEPSVITTQGATGFVVDGQLRMLYQLADLGVSPVKLEPVLQLQLHRRTRAGITFAVGATHFRSDYLLEKAARRFIVEEQDQYVAFRESRFRMWLVSFNAGYEFPTSGKWKPWVQGGIQLALRTMEQDEYRLSTRLNAAGWTQTSSRVVSFPLTTGQDWLIPNAEAGILYRLTGHWLAGLSVGAAPGDYADIQPTLGAEVRFRW